MAKSKGKQKASEKPTEAPKQIERVQNMTDISAFKITFAKACQPKQGTVGSPLSGFQVFWLNEVDPEKLAASADPKEAEAGELLLKGAGAVVYLPGRGPLTFVGDESVTQVRQDLHALIASQRRKEMPAPVPAPTPEPEPAIADPPIEVAPEEVLEETSEEP